jgi:hypothetical protein
MVQLRTDTNVTRVYFEVEQRDDTGHVEIVEGPALSLVPDVNLNAPYALWTVNVTGGDTQYAVAELWNGTVVSAGAVPSMFELPPCPGS